MIDDRISSYNFCLEFKWWKNIHLRNCLILIIYLSLHLLIQYLYQVDRMCPDQIKTDIGLGPKNTTTTTTTHSKLAYSNYPADSKKNPQPKNPVQPNNKNSVQPNNKNSVQPNNKNSVQPNNSSQANTKVRTEREKTCKVWAFRWFQYWNQKMKDMLKVITFLVGFYVSTMTSRWWEQVIRLGGKRRERNTEIYFLLRSEGFLPRLTSTSSWVMSSRWVTEAWMTRRLSTSKRKSCATFTSG